MGAITKSYSNFSGDINMVPLLKPTLILFCCCCFCCCCCCCCTVGLPATNQPINGQRINLGQQPVADTDVRRLTTQQSCPPISVHAGAERQPEIRKCQSLSFCPETTGRKFRSGEDIQHCSACADLI